MTQPTEQLLAASRALDGVDGCSVLSDWVWWPTPGVFALKLRLSIPESASAHIPRVTEWYVHAEERYPWGTLDIYPAAENGLVATFPHQDYNARGDEALPWREGDLCVRTPAKFLGRTAYDREPYTALNRLRWHVRRALSWLSAAARDELLLPGEPFELPKFITDTTAEMVAFHEAHGDSAWVDGLKHRGGYVEVGSLAGNERVLLLGNYRDAGGAVVRASPWAARRFEDLRSLGVWVIAPDIPVVSPWQAPRTWGGLRAVLGAQGVNLDLTLSKLLTRVRDGRRHLFLLGFRIPKLVGDAASQLYWQAASLPALTRDDVPRGFRPNRLGFWVGDRRYHFRDETAIQWLPSGNWHFEEISTRGRLGDHMRSANILLVGAGSLGSAIAELLVRAGVRRIVILDDEMLAVGNLVRHTLTMAEVGQSKAKSLAARLNSLSPDVEAAGFDEDFPPRDQTACSRLLECDTVIDCTGDDSALDSLARFPWPGERTFLSASIGLGARRLYVFAAHARAFPHDRFQELASPWLRRDVADSHGEQPPWGGTGCWSPVFPARCDDVWQLAAGSVRHIEEAVLHRPTEPVISVVERAGVNDPSPSRSVGDARRGA